MNTPTLISTYTRSFNDGCQLIVSLFSSGVLVVDEALADTPFHAPVVEYTQQFDRHERVEYTDYLRALMDEYQADEDYGLWHAMASGMTNQFTDEQMIGRFS